MLQKMKALRVLLPKQFSWRKTLIGCGMVAAVVAAFCCGRFSTPVSAQQPGQQSRFGPPGQGIEISHESRGPVAYIYNGIPVTREEFGDYLIDRIGAERLDFLINRKIIEMVCSKNGIVVTDAQVEAQLIEDLKAMNIPNLDAFVNTILKRFGKTLYEYKEDVIRPKIAMNRLFAGQVKVEEQDIKDAFDAQYGTKVECRIINFGKDVAPRDVQKMWEELKADKDDSLFKKYAREKNPGQLGSEGGKVPPIHRHFADKRIEEEAFSLKPGDISARLPMPDETTVILKCDRLIPADKDHSLEDERPRLKNEVYERKLAEAIPKAFQDMRKQADPRILLQHEAINKQFAYRVNLELTRALKMRDAEMHRPAIPDGVDLNRKD